MVLFRHQRRLGHFANHDALAARRLRPRHDEAVRGQRHRLGVRRAGYLDGNVARHLSGRPPHVRQSSSRGPRPERISCHARDAAFQRRQRRPRAPRAGSRRRHALRLSHRARVPAHHRVLGALFPIRLVVVQSSGADEPRRLRLAHGVGADGIAQCDSDPHHGSELCLCRLSGIGASGNPHDHAAAHGRRNVPRRARLPFRGDDRAMDRGRSAPAHRLAGDPVRAHLHLRDDGECHGARVRLYAGAQIDEGRS